jgi:tRNA threonylcarbamoyl adenosine modification protein YjeE
VAKALGIKDEIVSPTFNLVLEYPGLVHIDAWRITSAANFNTLEVNKFLSDKSVIAIEWAEKVQDIIRSYHDEAVILWVKIAYLPAQAGGQNNNDRLISWGTV